MTSRKTLLCKARFILPADANVKHFFNATIGAAFPFVTQINSFCNRIHSKYGPGFTLPHFCYHSYYTEYTCLQTNIDIVKPVPLFIDKPDWRIYDCVWFLTSPNYTFITIDIADATLGSGTVLSFGRVVGRYNNVTSLVDSVNLTTSLTNGMIFYSNERNLRMSLFSATYNGRASSLSLLIRFDKGSLTDFTHWIVYNII